MISQRINRIVGQLRGIQRMIEEKRDCGDILQQISAVKKAIDALSTEVVVTDVCRYIASSDDSKKIARVVERAVNL